MARSFAPDDTPLANSWRAWGFSLDAGAHEYLGPETELAGNGVYRFRSDTVGEHVLFTYTHLDKPPSEQVCSGTTFFVEPSPDVIYVQAELYNPTGGPCFNVTPSSLPPWADVLLDRPRIHAGLERNMLYDLDGDGELDPWKDHRLDCSLDNCPDEHAYGCRSEIACSDVDWVEVAPGHDLFVPERGESSYGMMFRPPIGATRLRIGVEDKPLAGGAYSIGDNDEDGDEDFEISSVKRNPCETIRIRIWVMGVLVEDRFNKLDYEFWEVGDIDLPSGTFDRRGVCDGQDPKKYCRIDADCGPNHQCGPKKSPGLNPSLYMGLLRPGE